MRAPSIVLVLLLSACHGVTIEPRHAQSGPTLHDVAWLLGSWDTAPDEHGCVYSEDWQRQSDDLYIGHGHEACDPAMAERAPFAEELRLEGVAGGLVYVAWPTGQERTEFRVAVGSATGFVAENAAHDFPTRIEYQRRDDGIAAVVSGPDRTFTLSMHPAPR